jgi:hypothetical protein
MDFHVITRQGSELIMQLVDGQVVIAPPNFVGRSENMPSIYAGSTATHLPTNSSALIEKSNG